MSPIIRRPRRLAKTTSVGIARTVHRTALILNSPSHESRGTDVGRSTALGLRQNATWSLVGNSIYALCQLGMLVVLARMGNTEQVGLYGWALALTTPIFLLASLQLRTVLAAEASDAQCRFGDYLGARLVTSALVLLGLCIGVCRMESTAARVVAAVAIAKAIESISDVLYGAFWQQDRMDCIAKSMLARGLLGVAGFALVYWWQSDLAAAQMALAAVWLATLLFFDIPQVLRHTNASNLHPNFSWPAMRPLVWLGLPAGLLSGLTSLQVSVPRCFVEAKMGTSALGVFTALAFMMVGIELVARSVNYAAVPRFARLIRSKSTREIQRLVMRLTLFGLAMGLAVTGGTALLGRPLIALLYGAEYIAYDHLLLFLVAISAVRVLAMPLAMTLRSANAYWQLTLIQFVSIASLAGACSLLVPKYGLEGCAFAVLFGLLVDIAGRCWCHFRLVRFTSPSPATATDGQLRAA